MPADLQITQAGTELETYGKTSLISLQAVSKLKSHIQGCLGDQRLNCEGYSPILSKKSELNSQS